MPEETASPEQSLAEQVGNRRASRERIAALGHPVYPNRYDATHLVSDVVARWGGSDAAALEAEPEEARRVDVPGGSWRSGRWGRRSSSTFPTAGRGSRPT